MITTGDGRSRSAPAELSVSALTVCFGALTALDGIDLTVRPGECVAIAGENGAGKTTLIRSVGGDVTPAWGTIKLGGRLVTAGPGTAARLGIRIVWQDLALCDNLDVASNLMLGNERRRHVFSEVHLHNDAGRLLQRLGIPLRDTTLPVKSLSRGQRQMVAVARAMALDPLLLLLDEPTASLDRQESALVEQLIRRFREQGTTILLSCHDIGQMFRLADRIVVLRHGRLVAGVSPGEVHPDEVAALVSGQAADSSAHRQPARLPRITGRLVSELSSSLSLTLSALSAGLGSERLCIHLLEDSSLVCAASLGVPATLLSGWSRLPTGTAGGPVGLVAATQRPVIEDNIRAGDGTWAVFGSLARSAEVASSWSVPVFGPRGLLGVITVFRAMTGKPRSDDLDLITLYASYAASAIERDRLLEKVTARNRVLETIREVLQSVAGSAPVAAGLGIALNALRRGLDADEVALVTTGPDGITACRADSGGSAECGSAEQGISAAPSTTTAHGSSTALGGSASPAPPLGLASIPAATLAAAQAALVRIAPDGVAFPGSGVAVDGSAATSTDCASKFLSVTFAAPGGRTVLLACWRDASSPDDATDLIEDAARSLRMTLERERPPHGTCARGELAPESGCLAPGGW